MNTKKPCVLYAHVFTRQDDVKKENDNKEADDEVRDDMQHCNVVARDVAHVWHHWKLG